MITVKCTYENGDVINTGINSDFEEAKEYYLNKYFNIGSSDFDNMQKCVNVELINPTTIIYLADLPLHKELEGKRINVTRRGGLFHYDYQDVPMMRVFQSAEVHTEIHKGRKESWLRWNWTPEIEEGASKYDCGFSGMRMNDNEDFNLSYLEV